MPTYTQTNRLLTFTSPLGTDVLLPESLRGREGISQLFDYEIELLALQQNTVQPASLIGKRVTAGLQVTSDGVRRYFNGIVASFEFRGGDHEFSVFRARVVPSLWLLTLNTSTRVFQDQSVIDILKKVLSSYGIAPKDDTQTAYPALDYCTQYRETDFAFVSRLMERHGIFYYFEHTMDDHKLVLADNSAQLPPCMAQGTFRYAPEPGDSEGFYDFVVSEFVSRASLVTGKYKTWDYNFGSSKVSYADPEQSGSKAEFGVNDHEHYDSADSASAPFKKDGAPRGLPSLQSHLQNVRRDAGDSGAVAVHGVSNAGVLQSGHTFVLTEYPQSAINGKYLLTSIEHEIRQQPAYRSRGTAPTELYRNTFVAQPASLAYRAPHLTPKPRVHGVLTGKVVVPAGEESYMDKFGRVCVQFWWDRERKPNQTDNTLLRVAQPWAGKGWGTYFWPRIDDEVLIDFLEGDPDAPVVVGSLYNGANMPKYNPAGEYTRSGILTRSSKGGGPANANELRFEDRSGAEQVFLNAERDMDLRVEHDARTFVGNEQHIIIRQKQLQSIGADKGESITGNHAEKIGAGADRSVGQNFNEKIGMDYSLDVGMNHYNKVGMVYVVDSGEEVHIKGGVNVVIEGGVGVCLSGSGGFISIDPSGVTIQGLLVRINSGGAQLEGSPAETQDPKEPDTPDEADDGSKGAKKN